MIEEHRLDQGSHDTTGFDCGVAELNEYLVRFASQDEKRGLSRVYVLTDSSRPREILGYYTLSAAQVEPSELAADHRRRLPRYPTPCVRIGRFAVHVSRQGTGTGRQLLGAAISRCLAIRESAGVYAAIVDAKDDRAARFYEYFGFTRFSSNPNKLYLPIATGGGVPQ